MTDFRWQKVPYAALVPVTLLLVACSGPTGSQGPVRLVDRFQEDMVMGAPTEVREAEPLGLWDFTIEVDAESAPNLGWKAGDGVSGLSVVEGRLTGKARTDFPIIYVKRTQQLDENDLVHSVEIRMRASEGTNLRISGAGPEDPDFEEIMGVARGFPWRDTTPILAGEGFQTYTISVSQAAPASEIHHVLISPTDAPGADFEIESVRLVTRK